MTDPIPRPTLLPSHATPRERAHAQVDARLDDRAAEAATITALKDPLTCPVAYLPYLAWERSVDVYDPAWPEGVRRAVIAAAPLVHALKGTPAGIKTALDAMEVSAALTEWWQASPVGTPYTFDVLALVRSRLYPGGPVLTDRVARAVYDTVLRTKPVSRAFSLALGAEMTSELGMAAAGVALALDHRVVDAGPATDFSAEVALAAAGVALAVDHRVADAGPATGFGAEAAIAAAGVALVVDRRMADAGPASGFAAPAGIAAAGVAILLLTVTAEAA